jgi:nucleoside phosphorylase
MKVLITFALANEFAPWKKLRAFRSGTWGDAEAYFTEINGAEVGVVLTGAGPRQAVLAAAEIHWSEFETGGFCISSGLAGALRTEYQIGQVLAARSVFSEIPRTDHEGSLLPSSNSLIAFAEECGATVADRFYSADRVVGRVEEKQYLGRNSDAVEMESFEILHEAKEHGIPAVAIRSISDLADEELPLDMNRIFSEDGEVSVPGVVAEVVRRPQSIPGLVRLGQQSSRAAESLAQFLDKYVAMVVERAKALQANASAATP